MDTQVSAPEEPKPIQSPTVNPFTEELSAPTVMFESLAATSPEQYNIPVPTQSVATKSKRKFILFKKKYLVLIMALLIALAGADLAYYIHNGLLSSTKATTSKATIPNHATSNLITKNVKLVNISNKSYSLLDSALPIDDPNIVNNYNGLFSLSFDCGGPTKPCDMPIAEKPSTVTFYKIGTTSSGQSIIVINGPAPMYGNINYYLINDSVDNYTLMGGISDMWYRSLELITSKGDFKSNVSFADGGIPTEFNNYLGTEKTKDGKLTLTRKFKDDSIGYFMTDASSFSPYISSSSLKTVNDIGKVNNLYLKEVVTTNKTNFKITNIFLTVNNLFSLEYELPDSLKGDKPSFTWQDGSMNTNGYTSALPGCGLSGGDVVVNNIVKSDLTAAGIGAEGQTIYKLPNDNAFLQEFYNDDYKTSSLTDDSLKNLTMDQYQAKNAIFVSHNQLGEWVAYMRDDMFDHGGCAKPVIYLYPTSALKVSVKVGAEITKSEPVYQSNGWQNVIAQPSGQLTYKGKQYNSLFWEGLGFGIYPDLDTGTVVAKGKVVSVIKEQLKAQGFNASETKDFMEFWQPKLPTTPYTLLRWLTTAQMNQLAPLSISPAPNTVIRTFLDFKGLDKPINIAPQTFSAPARNGFTVTEWGGLL